MAKRGHAVGRPGIDLEGALALVTGAGSGIGRATALALDQKGARVLAVDIDEDAAGKTAAECHDAEAFGCDVADPAAMEILAERVHATHGPLQLLVNNAGVAVHGNFVDTTLDDWGWIRGVNLDGVVHGCRAFGPAMLRQGRGHVINMSSVLGFAPNRALASYVTTKAAVLALSQCLRAEWRPQGVSVTAICPGGVRSSILGSTRHVSHTQEEAARLRSLGEKWVFVRDPSVVAGAVLKALARDPVMLTVGWEAKVLWGLNRLLPLSARPIVRKL